MPCPPWLFAVGGEGEPLREHVKLLVCVADVDLALEAAADALLEQRLDVLADDEDHFPESSAQSVEDGIVDDYLARRPHGIDLF